MLQHSTVQYSMRDQVKCLKIDIRMLLFREAQRHNVLALSGVFSGQNASLSPLTVPALEGLTSKRLKSNSFRSKRPGLMFYFYLPSMTTPQMRKLSPLVRHLIRCSKQGEQGGQCPVHRIKSRELSFVRGNTGKALSTTRDNAQGHGVYFEEVDVQMEETSRQGRTFALTRSSLSR